MVACLQVVVTYGSTYVLVALSIDRYDAIRHPMKFSGSCKHFKLEFNSTISKIFDVVSREASQMPNHSSLALQHYFLHADINAVRRKIHSRYLFTSPVTGIVSIYKPLASSRKHSNLIFMQIKQDRKLVLISKRKLKLMKLVETQ